MIYVRYTIGSTFLDTYLSNSISYPLASMYGSKLSVNNESVVQGDKYRFRTLPGRSLVLTSLGFYNFMAVRCLGLQSLKDSTPASLELTCV